MIVTLTLNPSLDRTVDVESLERGAVVRTSEPTLEPGGKGVNVTRALHAKGTWCSGTFTATPEATALCTAAHLTGDSVPVLARVSNGSGHPRNAEYEFDVRGLAVRGELGDAGPALAIAPIALIGLHHRFGHQVTLQFAAQPGE